MFPKNFFKILCYVQVECVQAMEVFFTSTKKTGNKFTGFNA